MKKKLFQQIILSAKVHGDSNSHSAKKVRHEIGERVRDERGAHEHETVCPVGRDDAVRSDLPECEWVVDRVTSVGFDARLDNVSLLLGQDFLGFGAVREIDDEDVSKDGDDASDDALHDKDPAPGM